MTLNIQIYLALDILFICFVIFRSFLVLNFRIKRGIVNLIYKNSQYFYIFHFVILSLISSEFFSFKGQLCFCAFREFFFKHCYFNN